jgi:hypothetical protein
VSVLHKAEFILFSGGAPGAEAEFGRQAESYGIEEVNFTFEGHPLARTRGARTLTNEELLGGDVSLSYVSKLMNRQYPDTPQFKKILQSIWHQINSGIQIFVVGQILPDKTVKGGTGWGAEFAKICNKPLWVYDQDRVGWYSWTNGDWEKHREGPRITARRFTGCGTRFLNDAGRAGIADLFARSFPHRPGS